MIELFFFPSPNGIKIAVMLEESGLPYRLTPVDITKGEQFHPDYTLINPNGKIPSIVDHDGAEGPVVLFESGAILLYLAARSGTFFPPPGSPEYWAALPWLFWQVGHFGPMAGQAHYFREFCEVKDSHGIERFTREMDRLYDVLEKQLVGREWITGEYGIVDMACWPWVFHHAWQGQDLHDFPLVKSWFERMAARPAVQRARQLGLAAKVDRGSYRDVLHNQDRERVAALARSAGDQD